jgi:hypothetical protein
MKHLLHLFFLGFLLSTFSKAHAQADRFAYAITDLTKEGSAWNALRKLDLQTGAYSDVLFDGSNDKIKHYDAVSRKERLLKEDAQYGMMLFAPFSTGVAAAAYDRQHNRLYFSPMFVDELRYIDLNTMKLYTVADRPLTGSGTLHNDEAKVVTRMVITPNGTGYAISNDGNTFVQFSTGKKSAITALGNLVDDPKNNGVSIHNRCSSFGGDMVADDAGNLYILSAFNHVFKVNTTTKVATHLGPITGLPQNFTVNGAVVAADGSLLVSSAVDGSGYFSVNPANWKATPYAMPAGVYRSSDLANSNYLSINKKPVETLSLRTEVRHSGVQIYPNPVTANRFTLQFSKIPAGTYAIDVTDETGKVLLQKRTVINTIGQTQTITLPAGTAKGLYLVKVSDRNQKAVFGQTVVVQ